MDTVPDIPVRGKKSPPGTPDEDDHETIATLPVGAHLHSLTPTQRLTQPTQLVDMPYTRPNDSVIQVVASSPTAPAHSPPRRGGLLSSLMAPSGTHFRPPATTVRPAKRTPVIDLDDGSEPGEGEDC